MTKELILFIDAQNMYQGARQAFFSRTDSHVRGQFDPVRLGHLIASKNPIGEDEPRTLKEVRVYTGSPDSSKDPKTYGAHRRQRVAWEHSGITVLARTLRYPKDWPNAKAEEKGVDVALAIDFVVLAVEGEYDVGVIASTDTDMRPALEYVLNRPDVSAETAAWRGASRAELTIPGRKMWRHRLDRADFEQVADLIDYNVRR